jgi:hypothetical protein
MGALPLINLPRRSKYAMLLALLCAGSMWFYVRRVLVAHQLADAAAFHRPRGILSDLYPRWLGARELLLRHRDPYSSEVTRDIQTGYYGRPLDPSRPNDPTDQQGFAYPVYVVFLLAPTIKLPFVALQQAFRWFLVGLICATIWAWMHFLQWKPSLPTAVSVLALTLGSFAIAQGILLQQLTAVVALLIGACFVALLSGQLFLAGVLLAVATIKPQLVWPVAAWLSLWVLSDWKKRQGFLWGLALTTAALCVAAELVLPGWIGKFRAAIAAYRQYTGTQSVFERLTTSTVGTIINILILLAVAVLGWRLRKAGSGSVQFALASSLVLASTVVIVSSVAPYNQILLLPAVLILARNWRSLWNSDPFTRVASVIGSAFVFWPWLATLALVVSAPFLSAETLQRAWPVPLYTSLAIPPCVLGLFALYLRNTNPGKGQPEAAATP